MMVYTWNLIERIEGPITVCDHTYNIGDRVYVSFRVMGNIVSFWETDHVMPFSRFTALALCDDGETREVPLSLSSTHLWAKDAPQSVTPQRRSAALDTRFAHPDNNTDPQSVTPQRRSVTVIDQQGNPIPDYPDYPAPRGMHWHRCENCKKWFPSKRGHAKTCDAKCRKALSRKERA